MARPFPGRVVSEDEDFILLEVAKHDRAPFARTQVVNPDEPEDRFLVVLFIRAGEDGPEPWIPWEDEAEGGQD